MKGLPAGKACRRGSGDNHSPPNAWEASDQHRTRKRHSFEWRFVRLGEIAARLDIPAAGAVTQKSTCQPPDFGVVSDLPYTRLTRATAKVDCASSPHERGFRRLLRSSIQIGAAQASRKKANQWKAQAQRSDHRIESVEWPCALAGIRRFLQGGY